VDERTYLVVLKLTPDGLMLVLIIFMTPVMKFLIYGLELTNPKNIVGKNAEPKRKTKQCEK
jgi:hypothetical protein